MQQRGVSDDNENSAYVIEIEQAEKETRRTMLNTRHKIATQITTINQLTNNWNELEEYIVKNKDYYGGITSEDILDKMKEIKDNN